MGKTLGISADIFPDPRLRAVHHFKSRYIESQTYLSDLAVWLNRHCSFGQRLEHLLLSGVEASTVRTVDITPGAGLELCSTRW